jgi:PAS domain S-box-containing protein
MNEIGKETIIIKEEQPTATGQSNLKDLLSERDILQKADQWDVVLKNLDCGFCLVGADHTIKYQSRNLRERFGDLKNSECYRGLLGTNRACADCFLNRQSSEESIKPREMRGKDGRLYRVILIPLGNDDGRSTGMEIFQEISAEETCREKINFLAGIVSHTPESVIATDQEGKIKYVNPGTERMFGYTAEELRGKDLEILTTELYKERIENEIFKVAACGRVWNGELLNRRKDGKLFYVSTSVSKMVDREGNFIALVWFQRDITQTKRYQEEMIKIEQEKAETLRILHENETAINRSLNKAKRELQEKNLELEKRTHELEGEKKRLKEAYEKLNQIQAQLIQSEKLASLGQLSAGVAHELNNPIGFVHSNLGTLDEYVRDLKNLLAKYSELEQLMVSNGQCAEPLKEIQELKEGIGLSHILEDFDKLITESKEGTHRIKNIVQNLKNFSYMDRGELQLADLNQGIESTLSIIHNELKYRAEVIKEYGSLPPIACFPQQLNQVFMNLLVNAAQAIETKGTIRIKTYQRNKEVVVEISDDGVGIPKQNLKHIFEPFFTTKEVGKGTGLGLSVVYGIIQNHKGRIEVESEVNQGSTFRVILPLNPLAISEKLIGNSRV